MKSVSPISFMGLSVCEEREGKGYDGEDSGTRTELLLAALQEAYTCFLVSLDLKANTCLCVSAWQGEIAALFRISSI